MISLSPLLALASQTEQGFNTQSLFILSAGLIPLIIFIASFLNKKSYWKLSIFDISCGILSLFALLFWYITKNGNAATTFSIIADLLATLPTVVKAYKYPETEKAWPWLTAGISGIFTLLTIRNWAFVQYGFPLYVALITLLIFLLAQFRNNKN